MLDSIMEARLEIATLNSLLAERDFQIETLNSDLSRTKNERDQAIRNKDSFSFLGFQLNKVAYNTIMWLIVLGLAAVATIMFLLFKRSHTVTVHVKNELETTQHEFDDYRKSAREKYEKLVVSHHNEIMKLKQS